MTRRPIPAALTTVLLTIACGTALADCGAVLAALAKSDQQARVAQYDVESRDQAPTGKPVLVRIGKVLYEGFGGEFTRYDTDGRNGLLVAMERAAKGGKARCEDAGGDTYRGLAVRKFRFDNPASPKQYNPATLWVAKSSGLPVFHEIHGLGPGGYAWVYGDAVKEPAVKK